MSNNHRRKLILVATILPLVLAAGMCLYVKWQAQQTRKNAEILLGELQQLRVGESTLGDLQRVAAGSQRRFLAKGTDPFCQERWCTYTFSYYTTNLGRLALWRLYLWRIHLTPAPVAFVATLIADGDRLARIEILLSSDVKTKSLSATLDDEVPVVSPVSQSYLRQNQPSHVSIYVKPEATPAERQGAYSFNMSCMDKLGGCGKTAELLPNAE
jgi:hypothetical protein